MSREEEKAALLLDKYKDFRDAGYPFVTSLGDDYFFGCKALDLHALDSAVLLTMFTREKSSQVVVVAQFGSTADDKLDKVDFSPEEGKNNPLFDHDEKSCKSNLLTLNLRAQNWRLRTKPGRGSFWTNLGEKLAQGEATDINMQFRAHAVYVFDLEKHKKRTEETTTPSWNADTVKVCVPRFKIESMDRSPNFPVWIISQLDLRGLLEGAIRSFMVSLPERFPKIMDEFAAKAFDKDVETNSPYKLPRLQFVLGLKQFRPDLNADPKLRVALYPLIDVDSRVLFPYLSNEARQQVNELVEHHEKVVKELVKKKDESEDSPRLELRQFGKSDGFIDAEALKHVESVTAAVTSSSSTLYDILAEYAANLVLFYPQAAAILMTLISAIHSQLSGDRHNMFINANFDAHLSNGDLALRIDDLDILASLGQIRVPFELFIKGPNFQEKMQNTLSLKKRRELANKLVKEFLEEVMEDFTKSSAKYPYFMQGKFKNKFENLAFMGPIKTLVDSKVFHSKSNSPTSDLFNKVLNYLGTEAGRESVKLRFGTSDAIQKVKDLELQMDLAEESEKITVWEMISGVTEAAVKAREEQKKSLQRRFSELTGKSAKRMSDHLVDETLLDLTTETTEEDQQFFTPKSTLSNGKGVNWDIEDDDELLLKELESTEDVTDKEKDEDDEFESIIDDDEVTTIKKSVSDKDFVSDKHHEKRILHISPSSFVLGLTLDMEAPQLILPLLGDISSILAYTMDSIARTKRQRLCERAVALQYTNDVNNLWSVQQEVENYCRKHSLAVSRLEIDVCYKIDSLVKAANSAALDDRFPEEYKDEFQEELKKFKLTDCTPLDEDIILMDEELLPKHGGRSATDSLLYTRTKDVDVDLRLKPRAKTSDLLSTKTKDFL